MARMGRDGRKRSTAARARAFRRDRRGVTVVEFSLIAPVFFLLIFSIAEIAMMSLSTSTFRTGLAQASRLVRTGDAQCFDNAEFVTAICDRARFAPDCVTRTTIGRQVFTSGFQSDDELVIDVDEFAALESGGVVRISATYRWRLLSPLVEPFFGDDDGVFSYQASLLFKNEEFAGAVCGTEGV